MSVWLFLAIVYVLVVWIGSFFVKGQKGNPPKGFYYPESLINPDYKDPVSGI